jgi:hypothetical protein
MVLLLTSSSLLLFDTLFTADIICSPFIFITEHLVSLSDLLKLLFCALWIVNILVWMVLNGCFFECFLNLGTCCVPLKPEYLVIVLRLLLRLLLHVLFVLLSLLVAPWVVLVLVESKIGIHKQ